MLQKILTNRSRQLSLGLVTADAVVFIAINPRQASASWLIIGYVLLGLTIFSISNSLAGLLQAYGDTVWRRGRRFGRYSAVIIIAMFGLQSVGQLTLKDTAALLPLVAVAYMYLGYGKQRQAAPARN